MLTEVLRRYQSYNPDTGTFDEQRSLRAYARLLDVSASTLSEIYAGNIAEPSRATLQALARTFPRAAYDIAEALKAQPETAVA